MDRDKDWLEKRVKAAVKEVNSWPEWKRAQNPISDENRQRWKDEQEVENEHRRRYSFWPPQ